MDLFKRLKSAIFVDNGLMFGVILISLVVFTWSRFVDWSGPLDDMSAEDRAALEGCIMAERSLGDDVYRARPDCRKWLHASPIAASVQTRSDCEPRVNDKLGGDDGLDTCGYPGFPKCLDPLPPGCP